MMAAVPALANFPPNAADPELLKRGWREWTIVTTNSILRDVSGS